MKSRHIINFLGEKPLHIFSEIGRSLEKIPFHNRKLKSVEESVVCFRMVRSAPIVIIASTASNKYKMPDILPTFTIQSSSPQRNKCRWSYRTLFFSATPIHTKMTRKKSVRVWIQPRKLKTIRKWTPNLQRSQFMGNTSFSCIL